MKSTQARQTTSHDVEKVLRALQHASHDSIRKG
jgi:hypothetical protein